MGELNGDKLQSITGELLAAGRRLGDALGEEVAVALLNGGDEAGQSAIALGAGQGVSGARRCACRYAAGCSGCGVGKGLRRCAAVGRAYRAHARGQGCGTASRVQLGVGLAQDCLQVDADTDSGRVVAVRPVYGGNALAKVTFPDANPQMVVLRGKAYEPLEADASRSGEVVVVNPGLDASVVKARLVETVTQEAEGVRLEDAGIVIGGGRGLGGPDPFDQLEDLARLLGGAVGASRAVCDAGWLDHSYQVGADRQDHHARPVHHRRHIGRKPAHGGLFGVQAHRRHQPRRGREHLQEREFRRSGRLEECAALVHRDGARTGGLLEGAGIDGQDGIRAFSLSEESYYEQRLHV